MGTSLSPLLGGFPTEPAERVCRSLLDSLGEACVALDADGRVVYCNPAFAGLFGVAAADLLDQPLAAVVPDFAGSACDQACARALDTGAPQEASEFRASRSFHCRAYPTPEGVVVLIADAGARRERPPREQFIQAQKLESLGRLAGGLAHDFNNHLVGMLTAAELLRRDLPPGSQPQALADLIVRAAERAGGLTRQLLTYAGKAALARRPLGVNAAVEDSLPLLADTLPKNVSVDRTLTPDLPPVEADSSQFRQVIMNLVVNAAEALDPRGGSVRVATGVEEIKDKGPRTKNEGEPAAGSFCPLSFVLCPSRAVYLEVSDDGCGMGADVLSCIFDPFFTTKGKGRGLGLSSVLGIVRAHGGALRAGSTPGAGTTLRVLLPAAAGLERVGQADS